MAYGESNGRVTDNVPRTRTELAKRAFCVAAPSLWNSLPDDVVDTNTVLTFKYIWYMYLKVST